uniref:Peptidase S1 domain-containing protein n=1 Tax=Panagrolaimus sp. ES5 TaxID=591445 RepID=A0AC34FDD1_9BILA
MNAEMLIVFFVAAIFLQLQQNVYGFNQNRIVNGSATPDGVFEFLPKLFMVIHGPYQKESMNTNFELWSSTIISKRHILTAAHCVHVSTRLSDEDPLFLNSQASSVLVQYRPSGKPKGFDIRDFSLQPKYYFHQSYSSVYAFAHDIAIVEFPEGTDFQIPPVKLASVEKEGDMAIAAGYGIYKWYGSQITGESENPRVLQNATVPIHLNCPRTPSTLICAGTCVRHADSGDSGGPLMFERNGNVYQVGVLSMGFPVNETLIYS